ncbi:hypothetical protein AURDEDRAFT_186314 [Auricularia subglabra TFB-10046 SS5]|nr:hypothetical protein AURDEDRAFT_186314 [Auricularia subglabra TFB-10046 SS5]
MSYTNAHAYTPRAGSGSEEPHPLDVFADGEKTAFHFVPPPARLTLRPMFSKELSEGSQVLERQPVVFMAVGRFMAAEVTLIPVTDTLRLHEISELQRQYELKVQGCSTLLRLLQVRDDIEESRARGVDWDTLIPKYSLVKTLLDLSTAQSDLLEASRRHMEWLEEQRRQQRRHLSPGFIGAAPSRRDADAVDATAPSFGATLF